MTVNKDHNENVILNILLNIIVPTVILTKFSGEDALGVKYGIVVALVVSKDTYLSASEGNFWQNDGIEVCINFDSLAGSMAYNGATAVLNVSLDLS